MGNREDYMTSLDPHYSSDDEPRGMPSWMAKEAEAEIDFDARMKKQLEVSAFARDFKRAFPAESFGGVYKVDAKSGAKSLVKSPEEVLQDAYAWLDKKFSGDIKTIRAVLDATGLVDDYVTGIMLNFGDAANEDSYKETEKNRENDERQPYTVLDEARESQETADAVNNDSILDRIELAKKTTRKAGLERSKRIGEYGIIADGEELQLWKKGKLLTTLNVDDVGGFHIVAEEVEALQDEKDVRSLFNIGDDLSAELATTASVVGKKAVFASGTTKMVGKIVAMLDGQAAVAVEGMDVEVNLPLNSIKVAANDCCVELLKAGAAKFCGECGSRL